jgi:2-polyprenyl-3-methyl-5-hydroxy-6-metoxy-1,4-benzoquinol methylase
MNVQAAYKVWSEQYDSNENKTRDLEAMALRAILSTISFDSCLEMGCGTGKNTVWLEQKASHVKAVDLSKEMMDVARTKVQTNKVNFELADINQDWNFANGQYDLAVFSLVLEHIENLHPVFEKLAKCIQPGGHVYMGELHPFKQYAGSKARYQTAEGEQVVTCFNHHLSDFTNAAINNGFYITTIKEYFDEDNKFNIPRILALLFQKQ